MGAETTVRARRAWVSALRKLRDDAQQCQKSQHLPYRDRYAAQRAFNLPVNDPTLTNQAKKISSWLRESHRAADLTVPADWPAVEPLIKVWLSWVTPRHVQYEEHRGTKWRGLYREAGQERRWAMGRGLSQVADSSLEVQSGWTFGGDDAFSHVKRQARGHRGRDGHGDFFHGRAAALEAIDTWIHGDPRGQVLVTTGPPGVGKSAVLCRAAYTAIQQRPPQRGRGLVFHARGQTTVDFLRSLSDCLDAPASTGTTIDDLIRSVETDRGVPDQVTVVIDALDEAAQTRDAQELAITLAALGRQPWARVVVATRPLSEQPYRSGLVYDLGVTNRTHAIDHGYLVDLDDPAYTDPDSLLAVTKDILFQSDVPAARLPIHGAWKYYREHTWIARRIAGIIARRADTNFLVAVLNATVLAMNPPRDELHPAAGDIDEDLIPATLPEAVSEVPQHPGTARTRRPPPDPANRPGPRPRHRPHRRTLAAIRESTQPGQPRHRWRRSDRFAAHPGGGLPSPDPRPHHGQTHTRLFHQALVDAFRPDPQRHRSDYQRILSVLVNDADHRGWAHASTYAQAHTAAHALDAGELPDLLTCQEFLIHTDPAGLLSATLALKLPQDIQLPQAAIITYTGQRMLQETAHERAQVLDLAAAHLGLPALTDIRSPHLHLRIDRAHSLGPPHQTLTGHDDDVDTVAVGRLGERDVIVSGGGDATVRIWDQHGQPVGDPLTGHEGLVSAVAVGRLGERDVIISGGEDAAVRIWDQRGQPVGDPLTGHEGLVSAVAVGRLGERDVIVSGGADVRLRIWDQHGQPVGKPLTGHEDWVSAVAVGRLGERDVIVSGGHDAAVRIWDQHGQPVGEPLTGHEDAVYAVAVGRLGERDVIVSGGEDAAVRIWDQHGQPVGEPLTGHEGPVRAVAIGRLHDRDVIISGGHDDAVRIWDQHGQPVGKPLTGHEDWVSAVAVGRLGERDVIVSGGHDATVRIWDQRGQPVGDPLTGHEGLVSAVAVGRLGERDVIVSGGEDATARIWDQHGQPVGEPLTGHEDAVYAVAIGRLHDRDVIISSSYDATVRIWDQHGQPVGDPLTGHEDAVYAVAVGRLGERDVIVSGGGDAAVRIWDQHGQPVGDPLTGHEDAVYAVAVGRLHDRDVIVSGGGDAAVRIWDQHGQPVGDPLTGHQGPVSAVAVGRLDKHDVIVSGGEDATARIWDQHGQPVGEPLTGHQGPVSAVAVGRLGKRDVIVSGGLDDATVRIWDQFGNHIESVHLLGRCGAVALLPDGNGLVAASDRALTIWRSAY